jgi:hypothetical protein
MNQARSLIADQNLYLKLLIMVMALAGNIDASLRQIVMQNALFLLFFLLDISYYGKLLNALGKVLPFFAGYWVFATLLGNPFPLMVLFSLKMVLFMQVSVYVFAKQRIKYILEDTVRLRKRKWGKNLVFYLLATTLFIRAYGRYFSRHKITAGNSLSQVFEVVSGGAKRSFASANVIERCIAVSLAGAGKVTYNRSGSGVIGLSLLTLMVLINAI